MAMTREEERELRLNCSIGTLLGNLSSRDDLRKPPPEESKEDEESGGEKRSAEDQGGTAKRAKDSEESHALEYFKEETPDFDEDDPEWVKEEKKYLIEEYGKKIVTLSFDDRDRFVYTCEICNVECNQKKMLEAHCMGMKHLRKKTLLDRRLQGKDVPDTFKVTKSSSAKLTKPSGLTKPLEKDPDDKKKWQYPGSKPWDKDSEDKKKWNYYNYGSGNAPPFYNQPPPFGPPPGFPGGPPPPGPPPNYYGQWGPPTPNIFNTPPPAAMDGGKSTGKDSLAGGDTGSLLQKLADCAVKNEKDSELAINVVIALMKSLKDFNHKRGETKFIEVLTEADVTFRVLKTLKPTNKDLEKEPSPTPAPTETSRDSPATGVSDFAQETPAVSQPSAGSYNDNQYYNSNSNNGYSYASGSDYPSPVPTGVPPPANYNPRGTNGYNQDGNQTYGPNQGYSNQGPVNSQANSTSYPSPQSYSNQGFGNQGSGYYNQGQGGNNQNSEGYPYSGGSYSQQPGGPQNSQGGGSGPKGDGSSAGSAPPQQPSGDSSAPDFSNYGYAAGYSMGYYNVPPPAYSL